MLTDSEQDDLINVVEVLRTIAQTMAEATVNAQHDRLATHFHGFVEGQIEGLNAVLDWFARKQTMLLEGRELKDGLATKTAGAIQGVCFRSA